MSEPMLAPVPAKKAVPHAGPCHSVLQRKPSRAGTSQEAPPIVHEVLRSSGHPLEGEARSFFGHRFGHDFSRVRVHADPMAMESARAVDALAYTVGQHIVLGTSRYLSKSEDGYRLLAHELVHTIQQDGLRTEDHRGALSISSPKDAAEVEAEKLSALVSGGPEPRVATKTNQHVARIPLPSSQGQGTSGTQSSSSGKADSEDLLSHAVLPPRGTNPGDCMKATCAPIGRTPVADPTALPQSADTWLSSASDCVSSGASGSNASHASEIAKNNLDELKQEVSELNQSIPSSELRKRAGEYRSKLADICNRKQREAYLEFHYNVIFESGTALRKWGALSGEWNDIEAALEGLPPEMTWGNPLLIRFRREVCAPSDISSGQCAGTVGGETNVQPDKTSATIAVYDVGLGRTPFPRSSRLKIPATTQTLQHEAGHVLESEISGAQYKRFFSEVLPWNMYSWAWLNARNSPYPNQLEERTKLRAELHFDDDQLDAWLRMLVLNSGITVGDRTYFRGQFWLNSYPTALIPGGKEFDYARSGQGEYLAEIYAFALSKPEWLSSVLPAAQSEWLREAVFKTPKDEAQWAIQLGDTPPPGFVAQALRFYSWDQLKPILDQYFANKPMIGGQRA